MLPLLIRVDSEVDFIISELPNHHGILGSRVCNDRRTIISALFEAAYYYEYV